MNNPIIIYHHPCTDGLTAAACAYLKYGDNAHYIKLSLERKRDYLEEVLPILKNREDNVKIYFLDCAPLIEEIPLFGNNSIIILDHHKTNAENLQYIMDLGMDNVLTIFDMNRSGAGMAWDYFHEGKLRPMMITYVEDRDLWKFDYESTKAFGMGLSTIPETISNYVDILKDNYKVMDCIKQGVIIEKYVNEKIKKSCVHNVKIKLLSGVRTLFINSTENISDVGNRALEIYPTVGVACVYQHYPTDNTFKLSLRSRQTENIDVGYIAKKYRGGGHQNSSGCVLSCEEFMELME